MTFHETGPWSLLKLKTKLVLESSLNPHSPPSPPPPSSAPLFPAPIPSSAPSRHSETYRLPSLGCFISACTRVDRANQPTRSLFYCSFLFLKYWFAKKKKKKLRGSSTPRWFLTTKDNLNTRVVQRFHILLMFRSLLFIRLCSGAALPPLSL